MRRLRTPILMYHHVEPFPLDPRPRFVGSYLALDEFSNQLEWLARQGFVGLSLVEALAKNDRSESAGNRSVVLTFDDACTCFLEHIVPELERWNMTGTVFAVSSHVGGRNEWDISAGERAEELLTAEDLRDLAAQGFEIASHGRSHADLTRIEPAAAIREVVDSKSELEALLGRPIETFCYPYAHFDETVATVVRNAGYRGAVSAYGMPLVSPSNRFGLPRALVRPGTSRLELRLQVSGWYRFWQRLPRLGLLHGLRGTTDRR